MGRNYSFAALMLSATLECFSARAQVIVQENPKSSLSVWFNNTALRLPAEQRDRLGELVAKFSAMPRCPHRAWYVMAYADSNARSTAKDLAQARANHVSSLLRLYGVSGAEICGAWTQSFSPMR